jgi:hypothetical protein
MKLFALFLMIIGFSTGAFAADPASILAKVADGTEVTFALDTKGVPRVSSDLKRYPTIKDFRDGSDYTDACYKGKKAQVKELLEALVDAADGDGDSYAELKSITTTKKVLTVTATITDESGENEEVYEFKPCGR